MSNMVNLGTKIVDRGTMICVSPVEDGPQFEPIELLITPAVNGIVIHPIDADIAVGGNGIVGVVIRDTDDCENHIRGLLAGASATIEDIEFKVQVDNALYISDIIGEE